MAYLLHRLNASRRAPTGYDVLKMATRGSARLLGRDDIGQLAVGKCADLFLVDTRRLELVGSRLDPKSVLGTVGAPGPGGLHRGSTAVSPWPRRPSHDRWTRSAWHRMPADLLPPISGPG